MPEDLRRHVAESIIQDPTGRHRRLGRHWRGTDDRPTLHFHEPKTEAHAKQRAQMAALQRYYTPAPTPHHASGPGSGIAGHRQLMPAALPQLQSRKPGPPSIDGCRPKASKEAAVARRPT